MKPGGRSKRPAPPLPSTAPFTVAEKVSTTTAGSELCGQGMRTSQQHPRQGGESQGHGREGDVFMSGAKLPCPVLFQGTVACTGMGEEHREAAERQKTDRQRWTDRQRGRKNRARSLPSYGGCFTGRCLPWLLGSTHHLGGLCWLQHKMSARDQTQSRAPCPGHTMGRHRASERATGNGLAGWPRNVSCPTQPTQQCPAGQADPSTGGHRRGNAG